MTQLSDPIFDTQITLRQSFLVLVRFLEQFNSRGPQGTDSLLSWLTVETDGGSFDPAQLDDFLESAQSVIRSGA